MFLVDADENQNFHGRIFVVITKSTTKLANPRWEDADHNENSTYWWRQRLIFKYLISQLLVNYTKILTNAGSCK